MRGVRSGWPGRRAVTVFQPHRYSRTRDLLDDFADVLSHDIDVLILTEVYSAGEEAISGADGRALARAIRSRGRVEPVFVPELEQVPGVLAGLVWFSSDHGLSGSDMWMLGSVLAAGLLGIRMQIGPFS